MYNSYIYLLWISLEFDSFSTDFFGNFEKKTRLLLNFYSGISLNHLIFIT